MFKNLLLFSILMLFQYQIRAQELFTLEEAIELALVNNFGIQIAQMQAEVAGMQVYRSNAGMGPLVNVTGNFNATGNNVDLTFLDGSDLNRFGYTFGPNVGLNISLPLYDGKRGKTILERLKREKEFASLESQLAIQNVLLEVITAYYNVILQQNIVQYLNTIIVYYNDRLKITEERWKLGRGSKLEFLQSQTDLNTQRSELAIARNNLNNNKIRLNYLLNRDLNTDFTTVDIISLRREYNLFELIENARTLNVDLLLLDKMKNINQLMEKEIDAGSKPQVFLNGGAGYNFTRSNTGFLLQNRSAALTGGLSVLWNIYDGNNRKNQISINHLNTRIIENQKEDMLSQIISDITAAYNRFNSDKEILQIEEENKDLAEENLQISLEKFKLGGSTILELNEDQQRYDNALNRLINAQYNLKITELELLRLSGEIY